ncbi:MAG TPA: SPOR domain-containing protein [Sphingomicrobium sp.]|nr:SPOR domain-containing protein [Sphingomicrobium sp.]
MRPRHLVAGIVAALISAQLSAQTVKAGILAWQKADYAAAVAIWRPLAQRGDPDAEFNLGQAYRLGRGVTIDLPMAKIWFEKAADAGHLDAETTLGLLLFQNGDHLAGLKWLRRAADQGEPRALLVYGTALYNGDGVSQDRVLGYSYVSRAANQGLAPAKDTLAQLDSLMPEVDRRKAMLLAEARSREPSNGPSAAIKPPKLARARMDRQSPRVTEARKVVEAKVTAPARATAALTRPIRGGWRIQLGAFSQRSAAESLYRRISRKAVLSGRSAIYVPVGSMTRLQVGPFESRSTAAAACAALGAACFAVPAR